MHVAILTASDAPQYRSLMLQAYERAANAFTSTVEERAAESDTWRVQRVSAPRGMSAAFGAFNGKELVGTVTLEFSPNPKTKHKALLKGMYVAPSSRGTGAGDAQQATRWGGHLLFNRQAQRAPERKRHTPHERRSHSRIN